MGVSCRLISLDDLIAIKESVARPKDLQAAAELRAIREIRQNPAAFEPRPPAE